MVTITGQREFADYLRAQRFHGRSRAILIATILGAMALFIWLTSRNVFFPAFAAIYVIALRPLLFRRGVKRQWQQTPSAHGQQKTCGLDETGFHTEDDEGNAVVTHWDRFLKFRESKDSFLSVPGSPDIPVPAQAIHEPRGSRSNANTPEGEGRISGSRRSLEMRWGPLPKRAGRSVPPALQSNNEILGFKCPAYVIDRRQHLSPTHDNVIASRQ